MYGTVGRFKIKPENREKLRQTLASQGNENIPGFERGWLMFPENHEDEGLLVIFFTDRDPYWANADDPEQDKRYREFSQYFESDPEWFDGEWLESS
jgi:heme-degrading monooxygenase HmoA